MDITFIFYSKHILDSQFQFVLKSKNKNMQTMQYIQCL